MTANREYEELVQNVEAFRSETEARRADAIQCRRGCSECCRVELTVCRVEADAIETYLRHHPVELEISADRCAFLRGDGACAIYPARPLVCRTQGLPLSYPEAVIPPDAVLARGQDREITWCPLNFRVNQPEAADVLDADRVNTILAVVNRRHSDGKTTPSNTRTALRSLAVTHQKDWSNADEPSNPDAV
ncbi:MAG: YkgJ family cysteine cluster protein [Myxococcota bacterium]